MQMQKQMLLAMVAQFTFRKALSNLDGAITGAVGCSNPLVMTIMAFYSEITIALLAACVFLLFQTVARARLKRELFFWTKTLDVSVGVGVCVRRIESSRQCCNFCCFGVAAAAVAAAAVALLQLLLQLLLLQLLLLLKLLPLLQLPLLLQLLLL
jgi:hypothetical protein